MANKVIGMRKAQYEAVRRRSVREMDFIISSCFAFSDPQTFKISFPQIPSNIPNLRYLISAPEKFYDDSRVKGDDCTKVDNLDEERSNI